MEKKKKLLVILGAGSSKPLGMPLVSDLDKCMRQWGKGWAKLNGLKDHFRKLCCSVRAYYKAGGSGLRPDPNFEKVLGEMVALAHWMEPAPWGDTLRRVVSNGTPRLTFRYHNEKYGPTEELMDQLNYLLGALARHMRALSRELDSTSTQEREKYRELLRGLRKKFDVGVYNLNYDTAALGALPDAYTGFSETGSFEPGLVHKRTAWDFVYHLHGSVHYSLNRRFGDEICWKQNLTEGEFFDAPEGRSSDKRSEGRSFPMTTLIAGGFKLDQLLVEPFHSLHGALIRHVYAADAILIGGYGFVDVHINRALRNCFNAGNASPRVPVMVLNRACDKTDPMAFRNDMWAIELCSTLSTDGHFFAEHGHASPPVPAELAKRDAFEVDARHRVALWHGGFIKAERRLPSIIRWLEGATDGVLVPNSAR
jgi:hypothetical protein